MSPAPSYLKHPLPGLAGTDPSLLSRVAGWSAMPCAWCTSPHARSSPTGPPPSPPCTTSTAQPSPPDAASSPSATLRARSCSTASTTTPRCEGHVFTPTHCQAALGIQTRVSAPHIRASAIQRPSGCETGDRLEALEADTHSRLGRAAMATTATLGHQGSSPGLSRDAK